MNDRNQAIDILKRARELLAERLTEQVLESKEDILSDALGLSYESEINAIYDKIGSRLNHVSAMLGNLPPEPEPEGSAESERAAAETVEPASDRIALPAPKPLAGNLVPSSFRSFALQLQSGDLKGVGQSLSVLFGIPPERGQRCAEVFFSRYRQDPSVLAKAQQLRQELSQGNFNASLVLLWECFGLHGVESIGVIQALHLHWEVNPSRE